MNRIIIDVREESEFNSGHVAGAINIPTGYFILDELPEPLRYIAKDQPIIVYCRSGQRAESAKQMLVDRGFTNVTNGINQDTIELNH